MAKRVYTNSVLDAVEESDVEALIEAKAIGERIRQLRLKRSMGLVELGRQTTLSASFLSQLETGRVVPTLRNLARIAMVFGKDFSYFFREEKATTFHVSREKNRIRFEGLELVFVIDGSLTVSMRTEKQRLSASDSLWIEGTTKRQYECHGDTSARALIITFPKRSWD